MIIVIALVAAGQAYLKQTFNLCKDIKTASDLSALKGWIKGAWGNVVMVEYPYPANFIQNLPAWPVKVIAAVLICLYSSVVAIDIISHQ